MWKKTPCFLLEENTVHNSLARMKSSTYTHFGQLWEPLETDRPSVMSNNTEYTKNAQVLPARSQLEIPLGAQILKSVILFAHVTLLTLAFKTIQDSQSLKTLFLYAGTRKPAVCDSRSTPGWPCLLIQVCFKRGVCLLVSCLEWKQGQTLETRTGQTLEKKSTELTVWVPCKISRACNVQEGVSKITPITMLNSLAAKSLKTGS